MPHFVYSFISWWTLGCFHLLAIENSAAVNVCEQVFVWTPVFSSFGHIPRSGIVGSYSNSIFNCVRHLQTFPQWLHHFIFPPMMYEASNFFTTSPTLVIFCFVFFWVFYGQPSRCEGAAVFSSDVVGQAVELFQHWVSVNWITISTVRVNSSIKQVTICNSIQF